MGRKPPAARHRQSFVIEDIGPKGDGIARNDRGVVFIDRGLPEDEVEASLYRSEDGVTRGTIERILHPSPFRTDPPCPQYAQCGGCSLQHASDDFYEKFKIHSVHSVLAKAGLKPRYLDTFFGRTRTRRRATFAVLPQGKKLLMGYYGRRSHRITAIPDCPVVSEDLLDWRDKIAPYLMPFITGSKPIDVFLQLVNGQCEVVITGPVGHKGTPDRDTHEAASRLVTETGIARLSWRMKPLDVPEILIEAKPLIAAFGPLRVSLPPAAFMQPTQEGQDALSKAVMDFLPQGEIKHAADLFCGCGTFTGPLTERAARVTAADIGGTEALARAVDKSKVTVLKRDLFKSPLRPDELNGFDVVVFDPPRAGAAEQARDLARSKVKNVIAVSCNPTTFAKDARILCDQGFKLEAVQIVDQFVWSHHVELVAKFVR